MASFVALIINFRVTRKLSLLVEALYDVKVSYREESHRSKSCQPELLSNLHPRDCMSVSAWPCSSAIPATFHRW
ncbi:hypothetical protein Pyn_41195 [Prunus yedoensis var. nudiflora]|uniref:Uncharacterized protein n=1 Tax=Prunus yedoensis var. nudiflora TaxID=2094558 RepID=A0A314YCK6_PRUYE|nr:hypothetical protein Pyn_41195 [Prunus yedoensis var. nudiflora]